MARDFVFRIKPGEALPPADPNGYRLIIEGNENQGKIKLLNQSGNLVDIKSDWSESVIKLPSSKILTLGSKPIELLPAPGDNKYYEVDKIIFEYIFGSKQYALNSQLCVKFGKSEFAFTKARIPYALITLTYNAACVVKNLDSSDLLSPNPTVSTITPMNQSLLLSTFDLKDPINGDGSLIVKVRYKINSL